MANVIISLRLIKGVLLVSVLRFAKNQILLAVIMLVALAFGILSFAHPAYALTLPTSCNDAANEVLWCGAATPQQVINDYYNGDGHNSAASIQNIYSYFGITASSINSLNQTAVAGSVTSSGNVIVNGQTVATGAITGGRDFIAGSTQANVNGTVFYVRPTSVSFLQSSLDAFVVMQGNRFEYAILSSCGNAVEATPLFTPTPPSPSPTPTSPNYTITKQVAVIGSNNYSSEVQVNPDTEVSYKITTISTGTAYVQNLIVKDILPNDDTFVPGTLSLNNNSLSAAQASQFFTAGLQLPNLAPNDTDVFTFNAVVGANVNNANCTNETLPNTAYMQATNLPNESAIATVSVVCVPPAPPAPAPPAPTPTPPVPPSTTQQTPTALPNTGPGNIIGAFIGFSVAGGSGYSLFMRRKLLRL
ncbi:hypothetical protein M1512_01065 [Patescibacteria group bacterium]|nr:hypothetical protein [Patescibacteria group bacterium]